MAHRHGCRPRRHVHRFYFASRVRDSANGHRQDPHRNSLSNRHHLFHRHCHDLLQETEATKEAGQES